MDGLEAVADVGQGPAHDDAHGVFDIGFLHLGHQGRGDDDLVRVTDFLGIVLWFLTHSKTAFLLPKSISLVTVCQPAVWIIRMFSAVSGQ